MADNLPTNKKDLQKEEESIYEKLKSKFELRTNNN